MGFLFSLLFAFIAIISGEDISGAMLSFLILPLSTLLGIAIGFSDVTLYKILSSFKRKPINNIFFGAFFGITIALFVISCLLLLIPDAFEPELFAYFFLPALIISPILGFFIGLERNAGIIK